MSPASTGSGEPLVSVILCTRNRAALLQTALASIVDQEFSAGPYEVIVIDNGSVDETCTVVERATGRAQIRYLLEAEIGLCVARNTGWRAARAPYVAYFDDDAIAEPDWVKAVWDGFQAGGPGVGIVGGKVEPIWEVPRPSWLADELALTLTIVDWSARDKFINDIDREWLVGANMAIPRAILAEVGGFHPWLDRVGANMLSSGDVFLQKQIMRLGYRCLYRPGMAIRHLAAASRLTRQWFLRRCFWQGVSDAVMVIIDEMPSAEERVKRAVARRTSDPHWQDFSDAAIENEGAEAFKSRCFELINVGFVAGMLGAAGH